MPEKVCLVGSGNWGSAIARIIGRNAASKDMFDTQINMWVYEEQVDGKNLTEIINETHVNVKYLPVRASPARPRGAPLSPRLPSLPRARRLRVAWRRTPCSESRTIIIAMLVRRDTLGLACAACHAHALTHTLV